MLDRRGTASLSAQPLRFCGAPRRAAGPRRGVSAAAYSLHCRARRARIGRKRNLLASRAIERMLDRCAVCVDSAFPYFLASPLARRTMPGALSGVADLVPEPSAGGFC
jgi:hypothetical protein